MKTRTNRVVKDPKTLSKIFGEGTKIVAAEEFRDDETGELSYHEADMRLGGYIPNPKYNPILNPQPKTPNENH